MKQKNTKGEEGEQRVAKAIAALGYNVLYIGGAVKYKIDGSRFCTIDLLPYGKGCSFFVQVKHKEPRVYYPDTGLELFRWKNLIWHQKEAGNPVLLLFTDSSKKIYGDWVNRLSRCISNNGSVYNKQNGQQMIYFLLAKLRTLEEILTHKL